MDKQSTGISKEDLQDILRTVIEETKKPDPLVAAKLQREHELAERARRTRLDSLIAQQKAKEQAQAKCPHRKNNGDPEAGSAIHRPTMSSDGMIHPICVECGKEFPPEKVSIFEASGMVVA